MSEDEEEVPTEGPTNDNDVGEDVTYKVSKAMAEHDVPAVSNNSLTALFHSPTMISHVKSSVQVLRKTFSLSLLKSMIGLL